MGFTPRYGLKDTQGNEFHTESSSGAIVIWNGDESKVLLRMEWEQARRLAEDLNLLVSMYDSEE